jgi:hypothetical protein
MAPNHIEPKLGAESFNCPSCGALAHQTWFYMYAFNYSGGRAPGIPDANSVEEFKADRTISEEKKRSLLDYFEKRLSKLPFFEIETNDAWGKRALENCWLSQCYSCNKLAIWLFDRLLFPATKINIEMNMDLPDNIKSDFEEAATIVDLSPRGAAALLRLSIQKLCTHLGEKGKNLDDDIAGLVKKGLPPKIQKALDIVRVIGNEAVHPGTLDLKDDRSTAVQLFNLVNLITQAMISTPKQLEEMYEKLPEAKREAIEKRDRPKDV